MNLGINTCIPLEKTPLCFCKLFYTGINHIDNAHIIFGFSANIHIVCILKKCKMPVVCLPLLADDRLILCKPAPYWHKKSAVLPER
jgi:hypothetical protein